MISPSINSLPNGPELVTLFCTVSVLFRWPSYTSLSRLSSVGNRVPRNRGLEAARPVSRSTVSKRRRHGDQRHPDRDQRFVNRVATRRTAALFFFFFFCYGKPFTRTFHGYATVCKEPKRMNERRKLKMSARRRPFAFSKDEIPGYRRNIVNSDAKNAIQKRFVGKSKVSFKGITGLLDM